MFLNKQLSYRHVIGLWLRSARNHTWTDWGTNLRRDAGRHLSYRILWVGFNFGDLGGCYANVHSSECKCHVIPPSPHAPLHVAHMLQHLNSFFFFLILWRQVQIMCCPANKITSFIVHMNHPNSFSSGDSEIYCCCNKPATCADLSSSAVVSSNSTFPDIRWYFYFCLRLS